MGSERALLERAADLDRLRKAVDAALGGGGGALVIEGEAGVGKTRLLDEAREFARRSGAEVLSARAGELEGDYPFAIVRQLLGPRLRRPPADELEALFDGAEPARRALGMATIGGSVADTFSVLHALYWVVAGLAEQSPLLLAIDDAHLADAASLDWLTFMLPRLDGLPLSLILARRTDEVESPGLARIVGDATVASLVPAPLSPEASATLIGQALGREAAPSFAATCHEITGGNPFLVTELGRELAARGIDPRADSGEWARNLAPHRVSQTVLARIARLPAEAGALARAVAILGDGCEPALPVEFADLDTDTGRGAADLLRKAAIFDPGEASPRFIHPLVRNAVYADLAAGERGAAHASAASLLRARGAPAERIALQLLAGEPHGEALAAETLIEAGKQALADGAPRSAVAFLNRALQEPPPTDRRLEVLRPLLAAGIRAVDHETITAIEAELRAAIERDPAGTRDLAIDLPGGLVLSGRLREAGQILSAAVHAAAEEGDLENAFKLDSALRSIGMADPSVEEVDLQRYMGQIKPDSSTGRLAAAIEARAAVVKGSRPAAVEAAKRALGNHCSLFEEEPELISAPACLLILVISDEMDAAAAAAKRAFEIARERNSAAEIGRAWFVRGIVSWAFGDLAAAESDLRQAQEIATLAGIPPLAFMCAGPLVLVLLWRDELEAAEAILAGLGVADGPMPTGAMFLLLLVARSKLRFELGDHARCLEDVEALTDESARISSGAGPILIVGVEEVRSLVAVGRVDEARARADRLLIDARRWGASAATASLFRAAASAMDGEEEIELLRESVAASADSSRRLQFAEAAVALGSALRRQNQRADARPPLREGLKAARRCGAVRLARSAHAELQATGESVRRYAPIGVESLTPSELRVAKMAASGMTNRQIAQALFVTLKTVEAHLSAAYDKLDIASRRGLAAALRA